MEEEKRYWDIGFEVTEEIRIASQRIYGTEIDANIALDDLLNKYGINTWIYISEDQTNDED